MFQFPGFPTYHYGFMIRYMILHHVGFPIRKSVGQCLFAANHSLSQLVTSFIGSWCQGIHLTLLFAWTSCIFPILWFSLNCLSFFEHFRSGFYWLLFAVKKRFSPFALVTWVFHHVGEIVCTLFRVLFPFSFGKTNISLKIICPLLFVFYSKILSSIRLSKIFCIYSVDAGRSGWTRTIDLALIRRAL